MNSDQREGAIMALRGSARLRLGMGADVAEVAYDIVCDATRTGLDYAALREIFDPLRSEGLLPLPTEETE